MSGCARSESPWFRSPYVTCWSRFRGFAGQGFRGDTTPLDSRRGEEEELWEGCSAAFFEEFLWRVVSCIHCPIFAYGMVARHFTIHRIVRGHLVDRASGVLVVSRL